MNRISLLALSTALSLTLSGVSFSQTSLTTNNAVDAAAGAAGSATTQAGDTTVDATGNASGSGSASGNADANNDGTISAEEQAAFDADVSVDVNANTPAGNVSAGANANTNVNASGNAQTGGTSGGGNGTGGNGTGGNAGGNGGTIVTIDTDGDGTVSAEERAAAATAAGISADQTCDEEGGPADVLENPGTFDAAALANVTRVFVVTLTGCDDEDFDAAGATTLQSTIAANAAIQAEVEAQVGPAADIVGAVISGDTLTVYVNETNS